MFRKTEVEWRQDLLKNCLLTLFKILKEYKALSNLKILSKQPYLGSDYYRLIKLKMHDSELSGQFNQTQDQEINLKENRDHC